jgi:hypothetical protein
MISSQSYWKTSVKVPENPLTEITTECSGNFLSDEIYTFLGMVKCILHRQCVTE